MFIFPIDQLPYYQNYAFRERFFSPEECERVLALLNANPPRDVVVRKDDNLPSASELRRSRLAHLPWKPEAEWILHRLAPAVLECNKAMYNFNLTGIVEGLQVGQYQPGHFYDWHQDFAFREQSIRKLSIIVQLSDSSQYEGGDLEFFSGRGPQQAVRSRGALMIFPSLVLSRISPVTAGTRNALEGWIGGPPFR